MQLANIKVAKKKSSTWSDKPAKKGTSLKNLHQVRSEIAKQEKLKQKAASLVGEQKVSHKSLMLKQEIRKAFERLRGVKVHDNLTILKKAEKRLVKKKSKSAATWEKRKEEVKQSQADRQQKRTDNIAMRRSGGKHEAPVAPDALGAASAPANTGMTRKQRRHQNLMRFGPKKTRSDREDMKKDARKERRHTERKSIKKTDKPSGKGRGMGKGRGKGQGKPSFSGKGMRSGGKGKGKGRR